MLFNSWPFVFLVVCTTIVYYSRWISFNVQAMVLIVASMIFYGYGQASLLTLLIFSISINAVASYLVERTSSIVAARTWATVGIIINLLILGSFKYGGLIAQFWTPADIQSAGIGAFLLHLPLPIGISFYTFQGISLLADTFSNNLNKKEKSIPFTRHFRDTFLFISFFPQLVAGPVLKAKQFMPQIGPKKWREIKWDTVAHCLITGYFLKLFVADNLHDQTFWMQAPYFQHKGTIDLLIMLVGYSAQIFADFAGYSLIAIGVSALLGYELPKNFNFPYIATSIAEFWRRWHISLSQWLKEYLYLPLGGNRKGKSRTYINLIIVMFLGGLWHGAAWSFAIWGLWHGFGLAIERLFSQKYSAKNEEAAHRRRSTLLLTQIGKGMFVFTFVTFGWLFFKLTNFTEALGYLSSLVNNTHSPITIVSTLVTGILVFPVFAYHMLYLWSVRQGGNVDQNIAGCLYGVMLFLLIFNAGSSEAFVYFQF